MMSRCMISIHRHRRRCRYGAREGHLPCSSWRARSMCSSPACHFPAMSQESCLERRIPFFECSILLWEASSLPVGPRSDAKIASERFAKGNFRVVANRRGDFDECRRVSAQQSRGLRESHTGDVLHGRFANELLELRGKCRTRQADAACQGLYRPRLSWLVLDQRKSLTDLEVLQPFEQPCIPFAGRTHIRAHRLNKENLR